MFRFHLGRLLNLDCGLMFMAALYGSESVGHVACSEAWQSVALRLEPSVNDERSHCKINLRTKYS
jgi:hypothetical protein